MNLFQRKLQHSDFKTSVALFRDLIIFFAILSYFSGWIYLNSYLSAFGLYLANLNVPFYYVFVFSSAPLFQLIYSPTWTDVLSLLVIIIFIFTCTAGYKMNLMAGCFAVALFFPVLLFIAFSTATATSKRHANYVQKGDGKCIHFFFTQDAMTNDDDPIPPTLLKANENHHLRLIWRTKNEVYAVNVKSRCDQKAPFVDTVTPTYRIPVSSFVFSEVIGNPSR